MPATYVFDAYGTLFDVHAAMSKYRNAAGPDVDRCSEIWRTKQLEYTWTLTLAGRYVDFWTLTQRALDFALARVPSIDHSLREKFLSTYRELDAFPDARATLAALHAAGHRTAILSNGTPAMLGAAVEAAKLAPHLDAVLSVDAIRVYKPRPEVYRMATSHFGVTPGAVTFISSNRWDVMGAAAFGFHTVWVNRSGLPDEHADAQPSHVLRDLGGLADLAV